MPGVRVIVMARAPIPGRTRTRLEPLLGPAGCARLQAGGYHLLALARPDQRMFALPAGAWGGPRVAAFTAAAADRAGLILGRIATEHDLDTPADVPHLLADPRTPAEIRLVFDPR